jgi:ribonuclease BN (tRNA processing enzyme)
MRLTIVGCGDAFGSGGRFNTCFKIDAKHAAILLDCGASSLVALKAHHIDPNAIDAIVLSHLHGDHFGGLPFLLLDAQLLIPLPDHSEFMMYGNDVIDFTILGLCSM